MRKSSASAVGKGIGLLVVTTTCRRDRPIDFRSNSAVLYARLMSLTSTSHRVYLLIMKHRRRYATISDWSAIFMHSFKHTVFFIWLRGFQQNMVETVISLE